MKNTLPVLRAEAGWSQQDLADKLGARVSLQHARTGKGKLVIAYNSLDELDGILAHIK